MWRKKDQLHEWSLACDLSELAILEALMRLTKLSTKTCSSVSKRCSKLAMSHCGLLQAPRSLTLSSHVERNWSSFPLLHITAKPASSCQRVRNQPEYAMPHAFSPDERCLGGVAEIHAEYTHMRRRLLRARPKVLGATQAVIL